MILDYIDNLKRYAQVIPNFEQVEKMLSQLTTLAEGVYPLNDTDKLMIVSGETLPVNDGKFEYHQRYLDIQIVLEGSELMVWQTIDKLTVDDEFDQQNDIGFMNGTGHCFEISQKMFYIVYPEDAHMPGRHEAVANTFKKAVFKIKIN